MRIFSTRQLVQLSLLICLSIVLTRLLSIRISIWGIEGIRIGFGAYPIILAGILFGPVAGGIVGAISDLVGYFINPMGVYMPHFTLTSALTGIIPAIILWRKKGEASIYHILLAITIGQLITTIILVPFFLQLLFKVPMVLTLPSRIVSQVILIPTYTLITMLLVKKLQVIRSCEERPL